MKATTYRQSGLVASLPAVPAHGLRPGQGPIRSYVTFFPRMPSSLYIRSPIGKVSEHSRQKPAGWGSILGVGRGTLATGKQEDHGNDQCHEDRCVIGEVDRP